MDEARAAKGWLLLDLRLCRLAFAVGVVVGSLGCPRCRDHHTVPSKLAGAAQRSARVAVQLIAKLLLYGTRAGRRRTRRVTKVCSSTFDGGPSRDWAHAEVFEEHESRRSSVSYVRGGEALRQLLESKMIRQQYGPSHAQLEIADMKRPINNEGDVLVVHEDVCRGGRRSHFLGRAKS